MKTRNENELGWKRIVTESSVWCGWAHVVEGLELVDFRWSKEEIRIKI